MPIFLPRLLVKDTAIITSSINPFNSFTTRNNKSSRARLGSRTHYAASYESDSTNQFYYQANEPQWQTLRTIVNFTSNRQSASQFHQSVQPPYSSLNSASTFSTFMNPKIPSYHSILQFLRRLYLSFPNGSMDLAIRDWDIK